ncbi:unnamed protein product [Phytophthora lilii]|uniref:Unnamed protein product n=1 Tax=Phytophthora lilii TaxID=2077276 RepID=A0A9W6TSG3_9STRA|nr:unnamed protein product [Phytophthora lilii]
MAELSKLKGNGKRSPAELSSKLTLSAWKVLAAQQLEMRLKAEEQQRWLRAAVADRSRIIYKMNALLQRSLTEDNEARRRIASEGAEKKCSGPLFKTLLSELPYLYLQTDKMFRGLGFHSSVLVAYEVRRERSGQVEYFEYVDEMVLPFDFERSSQVISTLIAADSGDLKDSITMKYQMVSPNDSNAYCTVHCALRRYQEDARLVFVWRAFMEGHGKFQGLHGDLSGCVIACIKIHHPKSNHAEVIISASAMADTSDVDADLLADVAGFLVECDLPSPPVDGPARAGDDGLLLSSHQLLQETETLLSALDASAPSSDENSAANGNRDHLQSGQVSAAKRREIRNAQAAKRRLRYRQKLKNEKETLQQEEVELTTKLSDLQKAAAEKKVPRGDQMVLSVWRAIATRQKERRFEAEAQQRQLRAAVINRARLIHQLNAMTQQPEKPEGTNKQLEDKRADEPKDGTVLFKTFLEELDGLYERTDQAMQDADFNMASQLQYKTKRTWKEGVEVHESADATVIPNSYDKTSRAVSLLMMTDPDAIDYDKEFPEPASSATAQYFIDCQLEPGETAKLAVHVAVRRYKEAGRLVFVWRALNEGVGNLAGYHTDKTGWLVVRPHESNTKSTMLESFVRLVPMTVGDVACREVDSDRFAEVVAKTGEEEVNEMMQMLNKMLLRIDDKQQQQTPAKGSTMLRSV